MLLFWLCISTAPNVILWVNKQCDWYGYIKKSGQLWYICTNCFPRWSADIIPTGLIRNKLLVYCIVIDKLALQVPIEIKECGDTVSASPGPGPKHRHSPISTVPPSRPASCLQHPLPLPAATAALVPSRAYFLAKEGVKHWRFLTFPIEKGLHGQKSL